MTEFVETKVVASHEVEELAQWGWRILDHFPEDIVDSQLVQRECDGSTVMGLGGCIHGFSYHHTYEHEEDRVVLTQRKFLMGREADSLIRKLQTEAGELIKERCEWRERERAAQERIKELEEQLRTVEPGLQTKLAATETALKTTKGVKDHTIKLLLDTQNRLEERDQQLRRFRAYFGDENMFKSIASGEPPPPTEFDNDTEERFSLLELE